MTFPSWVRKIGKVYNEQGLAIFIEAPAKDFEDVMKRISDHRVRVVSAISGYDSGKEIEMIYHFIHAGHIINIKFKIPREKPSIPSCAETFPSAMLFEQENHEFLGIDFPGNENLKPILLADTSPKAPLRKPDPSPAASPTKPKTPATKGKEAKR